MSEDVMLKICESLKINPFQLFLGFYMFEDKFMQVLAENFNHFIADCVNKTIGDYSNFLADYNNSIKQDLIYKIPGSKRKKS